MATKRLATQATALAFAGNRDTLALRQFFQTPVQYAGDFRWSIGRSLMAGLLNQFGFDAVVPVRMLYRSRAASDGPLVALLEVDPAASCFRLQIAAAWRSEDNARFLIKEGRRLTRALIGDRTAPIATVAYGSDDVHDRLLQEAGFGRGNAMDVLMARTLDDDIPPTRVPPGFGIGSLRLDDVNDLFSRGIAQAQAFGDPHISLEAAPDDRLAAAASIQATRVPSPWMQFSVLEQSNYLRAGARIDGPDVSGAEAQCADVVARDASGAVVSFAGVIMDAASGLGEFEPVGTRPTVQRRGIGRAVMSEALRRMQRYGLHTALVRTGVDNQPAIAAYEGVGLRVVDHLYGYELPSA